MYNNSNSTPDTHLHLHQHPFMAKRACLHQQRGGLRCNRLWKGPNEDLLSFGPDIFIFFLSINQSIINIQLLYFNPPQQMSHDADAAPHASKSEWKGSQTM